MLNVYEVLELEKRWQEYDRQKKQNSGFLKKPNFKLFDILSKDKKLNLLLFCGLVLVIILSVVCYYLFFSTTSSSKKTKPKTTSPEVIQVKTNEILKAEKLEEEIVQAEKEKIKLKNINKQNEVAEHSVSSDVTQVDSRYKITQTTLLMPQYIDIKENYNAGVKSEERKKSDIKPAKTINVEDDNVKKKSEEKIVVDDNNNSIITVSNASVSIDDLIVYFKKHPNAVNAIKVSKAYFNNGDYINAKTWALKANSIDKDNEDSWILFAKANYKLGNKQDAIGVLNDYLKFNSSNKAKELLKSMQQGIL